MPKLRLPKPLKITLYCLLIAALLTVIVLYLGTLDIIMLDPAGIIALKERNLMLFTVILGGVVIIPVFIMTALIAWRYREGNTKAVYKPDWAINHVAEAIWWGIPIVLIVILSIVTWNSTHSLDPYKPLPDHEKHLTIQVVSLDWKWLFIYPEQGIATVNFVQFPTDTSVRFELTSDTVMNSFWIPQLSGQLYAMPGMKTNLHLNATRFGDFKGSAANITGKGFAGMKFIARASSQTDFEAWVDKARESPNALNHATYAELTKPSENNPVSTYNSVSDDLFDSIIMKYMMQSDTPVDGSHHETMDNDTAMDHSKMDHSTMKNMGTN